MAHGTDQNYQFFESPIDSEQEALVIEEDSTFEYLSSSPESDFEVDNTAKGNPSVDGNESNESIAQLIVTQFFNSYDIDQDSNGKRRLKITTR